MTNGFLKVANTIGGRETDFSINITGTIKYSHANKSWLLIYYKIYQN